MAGTPEAVQRQNAQQLVAMTANLNRLIEGTVLGTRIGLKNLALAQATRIKTMMTNTPKTGNVYQRGKKVHVASSPGNPPAVDLGHYRRSIQNWEGPTNELPASYVGTADKRGATLEMGGGHVAPRPHFRAAVARVTDDLKALEKAVIAEQRKAASRRG